MKHDQRACSQARSEVPSRVTPRRLTPSWRTTNPCCWPAAQSTGLYEIADLLVHEGITPRVANVIRRVW